MCRLLVGKEGRMDALEKLGRLTNPQSLADYGLSVSLSELMEFDEGRTWVQEFCTDYVPPNKWPDEIKEWANQAH